MLTEIQLREKTNVVEKQAHVEAGGRRDLFRITVEIHCTLFAKFENSTVNAIFDELAQIAFSKIYINSIQ